MNRPKPGPYAAKGAELPLFDVFRELRDRWLKQYETNKVGLAARLNVMPQSVSHWSYGSDPSKRPPLWALVALADDLRLGLLLTGDGVRLVRRASRTDGPQTGSNRPGHLLDGREHREFPS
jgi:hypothetical protein